MSEERDDSITIEVHICEGQPLDTQDGHEIRVTIIQGGTSKNGYVYNDATLASIARLIEGAHAYADHARSAADAVVRSVRDVVGFYHDAQFIPASQDRPEGRGRVDATLHIFEAASWLWSIITEAMRLGRPELIGLSIDIFGQWQPNEDTKTRQITNVVALNSCDVVTRASAGGAFRRIIHEDGPHTHETLIGYRKLTGDHQGRPCHTRAEPSGSPAGAPDACGLPPPAVPSTHGGKLTGDHQGRPYHTRAEPSGSPASPALSPIPQQGAFPMDEPSNAPLTGDAPAAQHLLEAQQQQINALMHDLQLERAQLMLERRLQESVLPEPVRATIRTRFQGRVFEASELDGEIKTQTDMLAALTAQGLIRGHTFEKTSVGQQITEAEKIQAAFDRMFDLDIDTTRLGNIRGFTSILEAYTRVTGGTQVHGFSERSQLGSIRVSEYAPVGRISEADTTTASFSYLLGTSMNKRLLKDYQAWPAEWMKFCTIAPIRDFKQQTRVRFGAFGSLPVVAEDTPYTAVTLTDSAATYVPQKRGNLVTISRETIINDDLQAIKQIPTKLAVAAAYTLAEFVYGFLSGNPNIYDGSALFTAGAPHNNLGASALSSAAVQGGVTAMREQTNYAGKRIGLRPRFLVVPPELEWTSMVITKSAGAPGGNNNDINPMLGYVQPIVAPQLTSTTQWFLVADPREVDTIEIGFVGGQINPALFIQDQPLFGLNFSQDAISYKIRHEYGGAVVDYRGLYRGV
jgi:hypothetical protein